MDQEQTNPTTPAGTTQTPLTPKPDDGRAGADAQATPHMTSDETLAKAMHILARDIQSGDGIANAAISEAAQRITELSASLTASQTREAELAKALRRALTAIDAGFGKAQRDHIKAHGLAALQSHEAALTAPPTNSKEMNK